MLLAPLRYWCVHHPMKNRWDYVVPAVGSVLLTAALVGWPGASSIFGEKGFLNGLQNLYAILGGFFVAALTLVATAEAPSLKQRMIGRPSITFGRERHPMERRRFLTLLFGYLAFSCFALYAIGLVVQLLAPGFAIWITGERRAWLKAIFLFGYNFWLVHVGTATLVGLYYFTDRLQRPDPVVERDTPSAAPADRT